MSFGRQQVPLAMASRLATASFGLLLRPIQVHGPTALLMDGHRNVFVVAEHLGDGPRSRSAS